MRRMFLIAATLASSLALAFPLTSGIGAVGQTSAVPVQFVGAWNRNVKQANYNKYGQGQQGFLVGVWTMVVKKNGEDDFYTPGGYKPGCVPKHAIIYDFTAHFATTAKHATLTSA